MEIDIEKGPVGAQTGSVEAHWDHTFYGEAAIVNNGDELEDVMQQDGAIVLASAGGVPVPINVDCILARFALAIRGDDGIGFQSQVNVSVLRNGIIVDTFSIEPTWDDQVYTACGRVFHKEFAPCDLLSVTTTMSLPDFPISNVKLRVNLGFQLR